MILSILPDWLSDGNSTWDEITSIWIKGEKNPVIFTNSDTSVLHIHWMNILDGIGLTKNNTAITS